MSSFKQGPNPEFDPELSLHEALLDLRKHTPKWPPKPAMLRFARDSLNVQAAQGDVWYRSAWCGYYASRLLTWYTQQNGPEEVLGLLEPIDWSPLDNLLQAGKGVILATAHLGLGFIPGMAVKASNYPSLEIRAGHRAHLVRNCIPVYREADRKQALAKAFAHLRRGNIIAAAPDGGFGSNSLPARFLNQNVTFFTGVGELARLCNAQTCWFSATWTGQARIRLIIEPLRTPSQEGADQWLREWYFIYHRRMARQINRAPRDIGFNFGLWQRKDGVIWYQSPEKSKRNNAAKVETELEEQMQ